MVKNPNFGQKSKFWSKIQILVKNLNFPKNENVAQKCIFLVFKKGEGRTEFVKVRCDENQNIFDVFGLTKWAPPAALRFDGETIQKNQKFDELEIESGYVIDVIY